MKTIVSVTPTKVEADSRSFRIATSIARFGYVSILVEAQKSTLDGTSLPFSLRTIRYPTPLANIVPKDGPDALKRSGWTITARIAWRKVRDSTPLLPILFLFWHILHHLYVPMRQIPKASLYYLHGYALYPAIRRLSKRYNAPVIYDAHDFYSGITRPEEIATRSLGRRFVMTFYRHLESRLVKEAAAMVTISDGVARLQQAAFGRSPRVIRNCHDDRADRDPSRNVRTTLGLSDDRFLLAVIGDCKRGMAIRELLDAMLELPRRVHLAFIGRFYEEHMSEIRQKKLDDRVHILGPVRPDELVPFIRSADASVLIYYPKSANYSNCLPNGFFQAISAELPLLYPRLPEIRRIAERYRLGAPVDPLVPKSISNAVTQLIEDDGQFAEYKRNLPAAARDLSWEKEEVALKELISTVLVSGASAS